MTRYVTVNVVDEQGAPISGKTEQVALNDEVALLVDQGVFVNDDEGIFFQRQLEYIQAQSYDVLYPALKGRLCFDLNTEGGEGTSQITYRSYDKRGEAVIISGKATDLPRVDISGKEYTINVRTVADSYGYSRQEIAAAKLSGLPIDARKAEAARRAYEEKLNQVIWFGDKDHGLSGLLGGRSTDPWSTIPISAVPVGVGGSAAWGNKTPDEVIADLTIACSDMVANTNQLHIPNKILMSVAKRNFIMNTPRSLQSDVSILNWFIKNNDYITSADQIVAVNELKGVFGAVPSPTAGGEGFVVLSVEENNMRVREPFPLTFLPVQFKGLEFEINCYGRFAGLEVIYPQAVSIHYNI